MCAANDTTMMQCLLKPVQNVYLWHVPQQTTHCHLGVLTIDAAIASTGEIFHYAWIFEIQTRVGVTKLISPFSTLWKYWLPIEYRVYIWKVTPQRVAVTPVKYQCDLENLASCSFRKKIRNIPNGKIKERGFCNPHPSGWGYWCPVRCTFSVRATKH